MSSENGAEQVVMACVDAINRGAAPVVTPKKSRAM